MNIAVPESSLVCVFSDKPVVRFDSAGQVFSALRVSGGELTLDQVATIEQALKKRENLTLHFPQFDIKTMERIYTICNKYYAPVVIIHIADVVEHEVHSIAGNEMLDRLLAQSQSRDSKLRSNIKNFIGRKLVQCIKLSDSSEDSNISFNYQKGHFDLRDIHGPFDIIGDIHGCAKELERLLIKLGYRVDRREAYRADEYSVSVTAPLGRTAIFVGDLVDRGPGVPEVLNIAMSMVDSGQAYVVRGNHEQKLARWLAGRDMIIGADLQKSIDQLARAPQSLQDRVAEFLVGLKEYLWLDGGRLVVSHAGLKDAMVGRLSDSIRSFCLYGETTGRLGCDGLPERIDWAQSYSGEVAVVYGHASVLDAHWVNNTICIDTGCVFGGLLTALRWPERQIVQVRADEVWFSRSTSPGDGVGPAVRSQ